MFLSPMTRRVRTAVRHTEVICNIGTMLPAGSHPGKVTVVFTEAFGTHRCHLEMTPDEARRLRNMLDNHLRAIGRADDQEPSEEFSSARLLAELEARYLPAPDHL
jgi:hypothetical protein